MSMDFADIPILTMQKQDSFVAVDLGFSMQVGSSLDAASSMLANRDNSSGTVREVLETESAASDFILLEIASAGDASESNVQVVTDDAAIAEAVGLSQLAIDDYVDPALDSLLLEPDMPGDAAGNIDIYEPTIYVPEGFDAEDLYQIEILLDSSTGVLTILLHFSQESLDHANAGYYPTFEDSATVLGLSLSQPDFDDLLLPEYQSSAPPKCTVTITRTTTQNSGSSTVSFMGGLVKYESRSGSSSSTTTTSVTYEGTMVNGRCVLRSVR